MSDKFDMKLVIDAVTTPLLYARLSQAGSARVRAALLRSLAETALRGVGAAPPPVQQVSPHDVALPTSDRSGTPSTMRSATALPGGIGDLPAIGTVATILDNGNGDPVAHDVEQIADAFGSYF
jgi:hypothetical protein